MKPKSNMHASDAVRLRHMLDAASEAAFSAQERQRSDLNEDRHLARSLVKLIEIVGEAASRMTETGRAQFPDIPWAEIIAMRNRLIHAYWDIDLDIVWKTVSDEMPVLAAKLERGLNRREDDATT